MKKANLPHSDRNLTNKVRIQENDPVSEKAHLERTKPLDDARLLVSSENWEENRLRNNPAFVEFANANQWDTRRDRGFAWKTDVFDYIETVYAPWRGNGLLQSDIKAVDPKLYAQLHKQLSAIDDPGERAAIVERLQLPKENSEDALRMLVSDPVERAEISIVRRRERERVAKYRAGLAP